MAPPSAERKEARFVADTSRRMRAGHASRRLAHAGALGVVWPATEADMGNGQIKSGDVVELNSGGPAMTVQWIEENKAHCAWFANQENKSASFYTASLKVIQNTDRD